MFTGDFNDDIWDEHQWEAHLDEVEKQNLEFRQFISSKYSRQSPRWLELLQGSYDELDAVDTFIEEELQIDEVYFDSDEDEEIDEDWDNDLDEFFLDDFEKNLFRDEEDDFDVGEEWKELSENFAMSENGSIDTLQVYNDARSIAAEVLKWAKTINPKNLTTKYNRFVGCVLKVGAKIAAGYSFGFDRDFLGGNIAYTKKSLSSANEALSILQYNLKESPFLLNELQYFQLHEQLFMLRNNIGIYIQELREQFYNDI